MEHMTKNSPVAVNSSPRPSGRAALRTRGKGSFRPCDRLKRKNGRPALFSQGETVGFRGATCGSPADADGAYCGLFFPKARAVTGGPVGSYSAAAQAAAFRPRRSRVFFAREGCGIHTMRPLSAIPVSAVLFPVDAFSCDVTRL